MSKENTKHLEILSESELSSLYHQPQWNPSDQLEYFSLPSDVGPVYQSPNHVSRNEK